MINLISIHIPKTGGTSFYNILQQVYGPVLSPSYKRNDIVKMVSNGRMLSESIDHKISVLHGHIMYDELKSIHSDKDTKIVCWMRDPIDRVISNYRHFINRNSYPNPNRSGINLIDESLITYARREITRNKMSEFLKGIELEELFFIGFLESFEHDLALLASELNWTDFNIPRLNSMSREKINVPEDILSEIKSLNMRDCELYNKALDIWGKTK